VSEIIGMKVEAFPYFSSSPDLQTNAKQSKQGQHKKVLINIRGNSQIELVTNLIDDSGASCEFTLHGIVGTDYAKIFNNKSVSISQHIVDQEKYTEYFSQFDAMIFAYERSNFEMQSSGRLMDAIKTGVPVIVPRDTSMADTVNFFNAGTVINLETPDELARILREFHNLELHSSSAALSDFGFSTEYSNLIRSKFDRGGVNPIRLMTGTSLWMLYSIVHLPLNLSRFLRSFIKSMRKSNRRHLS
jgi:glycosyltransferase involved in cell wall biosynthesis